MPRWSSGICFRMVLSKLNTSSLAFFLERLSISLRNVIELKLSPPLVTMSLPVVPDPQDRSPKLRMSEALCQWRDAAIDAAESLTPNRVTVIM